MHSDVLIVGGGPAGLSAAIAARAKGLRVTVVDSRNPPIDKPCGEGLLPEAVAALRFLGVELEAAPHFRFTGIRFADNASSASSRFGGAIAFGIRRTALHCLLIERARAAQVSLRWGARVTELDFKRANIDGSPFSFRWLVAADGLNSGVRRWAGLESRRATRARFAFRRHYAVAPWTDLVEVYWGDGCQIIVTPTAHDEICVALFAADHHLRIDSALASFPELRQRLRVAQVSSPESGALTALSRPRAVIRGNLALVGDASCSIDGIAGQGINLAFQEAIHLAAALAQDDLTGYATAHAELTRTPVRLTQLLLLMAHSGPIRRTTLRVFAAKPAAFSEMMSVHTDATTSDTLRFQNLFGLGWRLLRA